MGILVLFLFLRKYFQCFISEDDLSCWLWHYYGSFFCAIFLRVLIMNHHWIFLNRFFSGTRQHYVTCMAHFLKLCAVSCDSQMLNNFCISKIPHCDLFHCCWIYFVNVLFRIFASIFIRDVVLQFSYLVETMYSSGFRAMVTF